MKTTLSFGATLLAMALATLFAVVAVMHGANPAVMPATIVASPSAVAEPVAAPAAAPASVQQVREVRLDTVVITGRAHRGTPVDRAQLVAAPTASRPFMSAGKAD